MGFWAEIELFLHDLKQNHDRKWEILKFNFLDVFSVFSKFSKIDQNRSNYSKIRNL